ncbi:MAG: hypothetical protein ABFD96_20840 [Armatimonadia bacterium]
MAGGRFGDRWQTKLTMGCAVSAGLFLLLLAPFAGFKGTLWGAVSLGLFVTAVSLLAYGNLKSIIIGALSLLLLVGWVEYNPFSIWFSTSNLGFRQFDAAVWKASGPESVSGIGNPRGAMLYSLLKTHRQLKGMTYDEVLALLGPPDYVNEQWRKESRLDPRAGQEWEYDIGISGLSVDPTMFGLEFRDGEVVKWWVFET